MNKHQLELNPQPLINTFETIIGNVKQIAVNARDLHAFLQVGKRFASWIQERIGKYEFVENEDFVCVSQNRETQRKDGQQGITQVIDYHITLDMAKELSMVENNAKGREARRYFIAMEKRALAITPKPALNYVTANDMENIKRLVWHCSSFMDYEEVFSRAVWYALRDKVGVKSPEAFRIEDLPLLGEEFNRIIQIIEPYLKARREAEKQLISRLIRGRGDYEPIMKDILYLMRDSVEEQTQNTRKKVNALFKRDFNALIERKAVC